MEKKIAAFDNDEVRRLTWMMVVFFTPIIVSVFIPIWWIRAILVIPITVFMLYSIWYAWFKDPTTVRNDECANLVIFGKKPDNCKETPKSPNGFKFGDF